MNSFLDIQHVFIADKVLKDTKQWLQKAGCFGNEAFVLWGGGFRNRVQFLVTVAIFPKQTPIRSPYGIAVHVDGDELFKINQWLFNNKVTLFGQVHSHPTTAFHSGTDDHFPLVTTIGQFSIVVPYFAKIPLINLSQCAVYRLSNTAVWTEVPLQKVSNMFEVVSFGNS